MPAVTNPVEPDSVTPVTKVDSATAAPQPTPTKPAEPDSVTPTPKVVWVVQMAGQLARPAIAGHVAGAREWTDSRDLLKGTAGSSRMRPDRVCEEYTIWSGVREYPETALGAHIPIKIDADTRPTKMFAQVFTRPGTIMVGGLRRLSTTSPGLDLAGLGPGVYNIRLIGHWQDNRVAYEFGLSIPGAVKLKSQCSQTLIGADPILALESLDDRLRTAPDSFQRRRLLVQQAHCPCLVDVAKRRLRVLYRDVPHRPLVGQRLVSAQRRPDLGEHR